VVVDGANVPYLEQTETGKPQVSNLSAIHRALKDRGYHPIVIIDASLIHEVDDRQQLEDFLDDPVVQQAPSQTDADYFVLETADRLDAQVVSNDEYARYQDEYPWIEDRRVPLMIVEEEVQFYRSQLGTS
jgi:predicted GTPase